MPDKNKTVSSPSLVIRPPKPGERDAFIAMALASWLDAYTDLLPEDQVRSAPEMMETAATKRYGEFRVAVDEPSGELLGYYSLGEGDYLWHLYVHPVHFRKGIGRKLLQTAEKELAERGLNSVSLDVTKGNDRAVKFYEALGFTITGVDEDGDTLMKKNMS